MANDKQTQTWMWADVEPMARSIVAAYSERIGPYEGDLPEDGFVGSMTEAFLTTSSKGVRAVLELGRTADSLHYMVYEAMARTGREKIVSSVFHIGHLAGGSRSALNRSIEVVDELELGHYHEVRAGLVLLSAMAINHLAD